MKSTNQQQILEYIIELFQQYVDDGHDDDKITATSTINQMDLDSVDLIKVILSIEEEFNIEFNDEELLLEKIDSIGDMADFVVGKLK